MITVKRLMKLLAKGLIDRGNELAQNQPANGNVLKRG